MKQIRSWRIELLKCEEKNSAKSIASSSNSLLLMTTNVRISITSCVINQFFSFLQRWNFLIEDYNFVILNFYHVVELMCVFENFNCMRFDDWWLNFETLRLGKFVLKNTSSNKCFSKIMNWIVDFTKRVIRVFFFRNNI